MPSHLIAAVPIHGHVAPLLPIAAHLVARGDTVRFLTGSRFADVVAATGATTSRSRPRRTSTIACRGSLPRARRPVAVGRARLRHRAHLRPPGRGSVRRRPGSCWPPQPVDDAASWTRCSWRGALLAELPADRRPPVLVTGVVPLGPPGRDLAPFGLGLPPLPGLPGRLRNGVLRAVNARVLRNAEAAGTAIMQRTHGRDGSGPIMDWLTGPMPWSSCRCRPSSTRDRTPRPDSSSPGWSPHPRRWSTHDRRGGPIWTVLDPSCTSPRAPSPTTT